MRTSEHPLWVHRHREEHRKCPCSQELAHSAFTGRMNDKVGAWGQHPGPVNGSSLRLGTMSFYLCIAGTKHRAWPAAHLLNEQHELVFEGWIRSFLPKSHLEVLAKWENGWATGLLCVRNRKVANICLWNGLSLAAFCRTHRQALPGLFVPDALPPALKSRSQQQGHWQWVTNLLMTEELLMDLPSYGAELLGRGLTKKGEQKGIFKLWYNN